MKKNIYHILFVLLLCAVALMHYRFAKNDRRNSFDFHEHFYNTPAMNYYNALETQSDAINTPLYAKAIGYILHAFGKSYFVLRMSYLLFFILYLAGFYICATLYINQPAVSFLAVLLQLSIPGLFSYSRMCWPHMYAAFFVLLSLVFLFYFLKGKKAGFFYFLFCLLSLAVSISMYYTSIIYVFLIAFWLVATNLKKIFTKSFLLFVVTPLSIIGGVFFFDDFLMLIDQYSEGNYFAVSAFLEYKILFVNNFQCLLYAFCSFIALVCFCLSKKDNVKNNIFLFVIFFLFTLAGGFLAYPAHVTVLGMSGGCLLVAWIITRIKYVVFRKIISSLIFIFSLTLIVFPRLLISQEEATMYFYKLAIVPDERNWGRDEIALWVNDLVTKNKRIALLQQAFYPNNGTNYLQPFDIEMMSKEKYNPVYIETTDFYDDANLNFVNSLAVSILSDEDLNVKKLMRTLSTKRIDYLIFDEIKEPYYWLFPDKENIIHYKLFKERMELISKDAVTLSYKGMAAKVVARLKNNINSYFSNIGSRYKYVEGYNSLNTFFQNNPVFREEKRIKCPVKDIVIYKVVGLDDFS